MARQGDRSSPRGRIICFAAEEMFAGCYKEEIPHLISGSKPVSAKGENICLPRTMNVYCNFRRQLKQGIRQQQLRHAPDGIMSCSQKEYEGHV